MKILYAARMARFDLLRATCRLACHITKWTEECDRRLYRLVCYINSSLNIRMTGWIGDNPSELVPCLYSDADFAGCDRTERSTTGVRLEVEGPNSRFPVNACSKRQGCISCSTPEAELVAGFTAYKNSLMPSFDLWDVLLPNGYQAKFYEDNQAMISVVNSGRNPTMKHLGRAHRIPIAWLHERIVLEDKDPVDLTYCESVYMAADVYTKAFTDATACDHSCALIKHFPSYTIHQLDRSVCS